MRLLSLPHGYNADVPGDQQPIDPKLKVALSEVEKLDLEIVEGKELLRVLFAKRRDLIERLAAEALLLPPDPSAN